MAQFEAFIGDEDTAHLVSKVLAVCAVSEDVLTGRPAASHGSCDVVAEVHPAVCYPGFQHLYLLIAVPHEQDQVYEVLRLIV